MGVASYRRGSALISRDFARDAYAKGWSSHDPDAVQAAAKPRPLDWGSKSDEKALDHARRMVSGSRKYGREVDAEVLALAVADKAKVSLDRATRAVQIVLAGPDGATKMNPRRRNPDTLRTIVLAWIDPDGGVEEYQDGWRVAYRRVPLAKTVIWANEGTTEDEGKARAYAKKEGNEVLIFPTTEKDPHGRAKRETLAAWKAAEAAKEAARVKAEAKARRRKVVNPKPRRNPTKGSTDFFTSPNRDDMRYMVIAHQDAADRFAKDGRHRHNYVQKMVVEAHEKAAKAWARASDFGLSKKAAKAALSEAEERSEIAEKCENEFRQRFSEQERMKALLKQAKSNPRRKNPSGSVTAALNVPQKTNRGILIEWTARLPGLHQETLSGHVIGRRGKPLAGFVLAPLFRDGRIGVIHDQRGGIVG